MQVVKLEMLRLLSLFCTFCYMGEATLTFEQMEELYNSELQMTVPPGTFTRNVSAANSVSFNKSRQSFEISETALIDGSSPEVNVVEAKITDPTLHKSYPKHTCSKKLSAVTSPTGGKPSMIQKWVFAFRTEGDAGPSDEVVIASILKSGLTVTIKVGERQCSINPIDYEMEIVKKSASEFGLRIPQNLLKCMSLHDISTWSSISYKNTGNVLVSLKKENFVNAKEYCYVVPMFGVPEEIPDQLEVTATKVGGSILDLNTIKCTTSVVEIYNNASKSWQRRAQLEFIRGQVTSAHMISGYHNKSKNTGIEYKFDDHVLYQFVMFK